MGNRGFWDKLKKPIIGLSPMDGVTDPAFRHMLCKYSRPSVVFTEFVNVEGLARGATKMLHAFLYEENERPIVAQLFGIEVDSFYKAAILLCALGFDGIDINMGCPVNKVARKGSGAALIKTPELAKKIIMTVKKAAYDWANGISIEEGGVHENIIKEIKAINEKGARSALLHSPYWLGNPSGRLKRKIVPVSVKTRIGYDKIIVEDWLKHLLETKPANITMHGRTLKQMYGGEADWEALSRGAAICKGSGTSFLGNGDVKSTEDAKEKIKKYGVDGVLVGRAVLGNPWFFGEKIPTYKMRLKALREHVKYFEKLDIAPFCNVKKHLGYYCKGFDGAKETRMKLMQTSSADDVKFVLSRV